jgi:hypothetical protein
MSTEEIYTFEMIQKTKNFTPTPVDIKTRIVLFQMTRVIVVVARPLDATSFENGYPTTEELVCSAVSEERVCSSCATCISHTISHGTTQPSIHLRLEQGSESQLP